MAALRAEIERTNKIRMAEEKASREADRKNYEKMFKKSEDEKKKLEKDRHKPEQERLQLSQQAEQLHLASVEAAKRLQEENL